jgi:hypothetical protein
MAVLERNQTAEDLAKDPGPLQEWCRRYLAAHPSERSGWGVFRPSPERESKRFRNFLRGFSSVGFGAWGAQETRMFHVAQPQDWRSTLDSIGSDWEAVGSDVASVMLAYRPDNYHKDTDR